VKDLVLTAKDTGERLLTLRGGEVNFEIQKLIGREVSSVTLMEPSFVISPRFLGMFGPGGPAKPAGGNLAGGWRIGRIECQYGEFEMAGLGSGNLHVQARFAFDIVRPLHGDSPDQTLILWDIQASPGDDQPVVVVDLAEVGFHIQKLKAGRVRSVDLKGGSVFLGERLLGLFKENPGSTPSGAGQWVLDQLKISRIGIRLEDDREFAPDVNFDLNTTLSNVPLGKAASALGEEIQQLEIADLEILSPLDPLAKVLSVRSLVFEFTLAGLLRHEIRSVTVSSPSIYVSPDLFWYMDDAQARFARPPVGSESSNDPVAEPTPGWIVKRFVLVDGRLILGSGGRTNYGLPLTFRTSAEDVSLENLASLRAQAIMEIPSQAYTFENYQLEFTSREGELRLAYPPEKNENNLVGTIYLDDIRWRQYRASDSWVSVTFDRGGINGSFGGTTYKGYSAGGFSFFFNSDSPWIGWIAGEGIDLKKLTHVISPQNFQMTGPLDYQVQVDAQRALIQRMKGEFQTTKGGRLKVGKLDDLLGRIPGDWPGLKKDSTRIALETLRDFDYETCKGKFWFVDAQGVLDLGLQGPSGSRNFEIVLHADSSQDGLWKKQKSR
jgi:hypothetical protein